MRSWRLSWLPLRMGSTLRGRYKVQSQEDIKKALGRSPDRANALGLAVYDPPPPRSRRERGEGGNA